MVANRSTHEAIDRRTPFPWHRHELIWSDAHCPLLRALRDSRLDECKATCLADERCTAFNFDGMHHRGCEMRQCAQGESPQQRSVDGWLGYSSFSVQEKALTMPPPAVVQLPAILTVAALLTVLVGVLVWLLKPKLVEAWARCARAPYGSRVEARGLREAHHSLSRESLTLDAASLECDEDGDTQTWSPVLTDPVACSSKDYLCGA
jgi:hypothetical protein